MNYLLRIRLCGRICDDCEEPLANTKVRLYQTENDDVAMLAATDPKNTFKKLTEAAVKKKSSRLLVEGTTDSDGRLDIEFPKDYNGEAFEVDIQVNRLDKKDKTIQFHLTTLAPTWHRTGNGYIAAWEHCLSHRIWCLILSLIGRWVICGRVVHCETQKPIGGVKVEAFDRDWLQDDSLGDAITDGNGVFKIDYTKADFSPGTWIDVELFGGPDLYFHVTHGAGVPLLIEPPSKGREPGRENVSNCFCVTLCLEDDIPSEKVEPPPVFTHVGGYNHQTQIDSAVGASGLTSGSGRTFFSTIRLNGALPKKYQGGQTEYRFEVRQVQADGTPIGGWSVVDISQIGRTEIGELLKYAPTSPTDPNPIKSQPYTVNGNAGELEANVVGGWIRVPQESSVFGPSGYFQPNGNQIRLNTKTLLAWSDVDLSGLVTGDSSTSTGQPLVQNRYFSIRMRVRKVGGVSSVAGICQQIAINNSLYDNILRHPAWMPVNLVNALGVAMVDIQQLADGGGCVGIGNTLDVKFTAAHPSLGNVSIGMSGPGGPYSFNLPAAVPGERFGTATPNGFTVSALDPCAYIVTLSVQLLLTTGDSVPDNLVDQIAFCKT